MNTKTFDIVFDSNDNSNNKGFRESLAFCKGYVAQHNGTTDSYFKDYKGGTVRIVCNETEETVYQTEVL